MITPKLLYLENRELKPLFEAAGNLELLSGYMKESDRRLMGLGNPDHHPTGRL